MGLQFITGDSGAGKSWYAYHDLLEQAQLHPDRNYLILVPEQFTMQTQKELVSMHPSGSILNIDILSFQRLAYRIFEETGGSLSPVLGETGKSLVIKRVAQEKKNELLVLGSALKKTGVISQMKSLISELKQYCVDPLELEEWRKEAGENKLLGAKLKDVETIYEGFEEALQERYITNEDVLEVLAEKVEDSALIRNSDILVDGFTGFTPVQIRVLGQLFSFARKVCVTAILDEREDPYQKGKPQDLFFMSRKMILDLLQEAENCGCPVEKEIRIARSRNGRFCHSPELDFLEQNLFRFPKKKERALYQGSAGSAIHISLAENPRKELEETARCIRQLVREKGMRYQDFAVLAGDLTVYGPYAREIFKRSGIPCFLDEKHSVLQNPFVEFLRAALDVVIQGFSYESVFRYLRCGYSNLTLREIDRMENYCLALGIRGAKGYSETWTRSYRGLDPEEVPELNTFRIRFWDEISEFAEKEKQHGITVRERTEALYRLAVKNGIQEKLEEDAGRFEVLGKEEMAGEYHQIYRIVMELLDKVVEILGEENLSLSEYQELLEAGLSEASVGVIPPTSDQVLVGDNERTRLCNIRVLFFVGVNDGLIPRRESKGGILSEFDREELEQTAARLSPTAREEMYRQKFHLYRNLTRPSRELYLSFSRASASGEAINPSYLITEICRMFPDLTIRDLEKEPEEAHLPESPAMGVELFLEGLAEEAKGEKNDLFEELYRWYTVHPESGVPVEKYRKAAFFHPAEGKIGKSAAQALYGTVLTNSPTRLEKYAACAFAHFLEYGLHIREREQYEVKASDMGTILHDTLELFSKKLSLSGKSWRTMDQELRDHLVEECADEVMMDYGNTIFQSSRRNEYQIRRVKRILKRTVWALQEQTRLSGFEPGGFEVSFSMEDALSSINIALSDREKLRLRGRIDRVDLCETDDKVYVKIMDYKSGNTSLDLLELFYGLQLQLVVYLDAAVELEEKKHPEKEVEPAGIFYYHIKDPVLEEKEESEEEWKKRFLSAFRLNGLVNGEPEVVSLLDTTLNEGTSSAIVPVGRKKDGNYTAASQVAAPEDFETIRLFTRKKIQEIGKEILDGNTRIDPYERKGKTACDWCPYHGICGFDRKIPGFSYRRLTEMNQDILLKKMEQYGKEEQEKWQ